MIRIKIQYHDGTTRQFLPETWAQIFRLSEQNNIQLLTVFAITPRELTEYQKLIESRNLDFMRVVR